MFEVYDPFTFYFDLRLNWLALCFFFFFLVFNYWGILGRLGVRFGLIIGFLVSEFVTFFSFSKIKTSLLFFVCLFFYILFINILGLIPYVFSCSTHFVFSIRLALPFWLGLMILGWLNFTNSMFRHLIPVGTPVLLMSFMVLIETVSNFIRPWSLRVRLMANMISGHLLIRLLGECGRYFVPVGLCLFAFEFFVCFIQGYVFCALLTLYSREI